MDKGDAKLFIGLGRYASKVHEWFRDPDNSDKMSSQTRYCYECGKTMKLIQNKHGAHWYCECGHELPEKAKDRPVMRKSGWNKEYISALKEAGFMVNKEN